jgi:hypothetical protein
VAALVRVTRRLSSRITIADKPTKANHRVQELCVASKERDFTCPRDPEHGISLQDYIGSSLTINFSSEMVMGKVAGARFSPESLAEHGVPRDTPLGKKEGRILTVVNRGGCLLLFETSKNIVNWPNAL